MLSQGSMDFVLRWAVFTGNLEHEIKELGCLGSMEHE